METPMLSFFIGNLPMWWIPKGISQGLASGRPKNSMGKPSKSAGSNICFAAHAWCLKSSKRCRHDWFVTRRIFKVEMSSGSCRDQSNPARKWYKNHWWYWCMSMGILRLREPMLTSQNIPSMTTSGHVGPLWPGRTYGRISPGPHRSGDWL